MLTKSQQDAKIKAAKARLAKAEAAAASVTSIQAEITWLEAAPVTADRVRKPRAKKAAAAPVENENTEAQA